MDFFSILISVNKISIIFFFITLAFLVYEFYLLRKQQKKNAAPSIPNFNETLHLNIPATQTVVKGEDKKVNFKKPNHMIIVVLIILVVLFAGISIIGLFQSSTDTTIPVLQTTLPSPSPKISITDAPTNAFVADSTATLSVTPTVSSTPTGGFEVGTISPTQTSTLSLTPTEVIIGYKNPSISPLSESSGGTSTDASVSATITKMQSLPQTGFINNSLVLFAVASTFIIVAFIF